MAGEENAKLEL